MAQQEDNIKTHGGGDSMNGAQHLPGRILLRAVVSIGSTATCLGPVAPPPPQCWNRVYMLLEATQLWDFITVAPGTNAHPSFLSGSPGPAKQDAVEGKVDDWRAQISHGCCSHC